MTDTNYSIFERNVMHAFEGAANSPEALETGCAAFLRGHKKGALAAEKAGLEAIALLKGGLRQMLDKAAEILFEQKPELERPGVAQEVEAFILERSYRRHFPAN